MTQSQNLRVISFAARSAIHVRRTIRYEFNADYTVTPSLTLTSQTAYNKDHLYSTEDYNRFNTVPGAFSWIRAATYGLVGTGWRILRSAARLLEPTCRAGRLAANTPHQFYQEVRLASNFDGPLNFVRRRELPPIHNDRRLLSCFRTRSRLHRTFQQVRQSAAQCSAPMRRIFRSMRAVANACGPQPASDALAVNRRFWAWAAPISIPIRSAISTGRATIISAAKIPIA